jgi:methanethiol S-methyltransferase
MWFISGCVIFVEFIVYGMLHSIMASTLVKKWVENKYPSYSKYYRLIYSLFAGIALLPIFYLVHALPRIVFYSIKPPLIYITVIIQCLVGLVVLFGVLQTDNFSFLGISQAFYSTTQQDHLVTSGLYHYVRHPIYSLGLVIVWLYPLMNSNYFFFVTSITLYIIFGARLEEEKLNKEYPDYDSYRQVTPMFIPRFFH